MFEVYAITATIGLWAAIGIALVESDRRKAWRDHAEWLLEKDSGND